jgi:hypothetical protein
MDSEIHVSSTVQSADTSSSQNQRVLDQLSDIINDYLRKNPRVSLNGLSKRCQVSEPTIRRIAKKQVKTVPTVSTILDLLTTIQRNKNVREVVQAYPGPVAELIRESLPHLEEHEPEYSQVINDYLRDPIKYLVFKLSLNKMGVSRERVKKIFGDHGARELDHLVQMDFVEKRGHRYFSKPRNFYGSFENFVEHFRASAGFIKPHKAAENRPLGPLFLNASESVSADAYREVSRVQRAALKKISQIIKGDEAGGPIPLMFLCAIDTLDTESAFEIVSRGNNIL